MTFFPRQTIELHAFQPKALRRFSFSLVEMAIVTGVLLRVYRSLVMTHGSNSWVYFGATQALDEVLLLGMATTHLANYPLHQWTWRVPVFAAVESAAEMVTSALLIFMGREPFGAASAHWADWVVLASRTLVLRGVAIVFWGALLAGVVQFVRTKLVREEPDDPASIRP
ncbi:MAG TPA: hypothetical protein VMH39_06600 [Gemmatimonadaceae bacterium]|nr:hypothetical protein [Gemmatimonadaceae bacterium]